MHFYKVGWYTHDGQKYAYLTHHAKFTEEEFHRYVEGATLLFLHERREQIPKAETLGELQDLMIGSPGFENILHGTVEQLIKAYDFNPLKIEAAWDCDGWANAFNPPEGKSYEYNEALTNLATRIKKADLSWKHDFADPYHKLFQKLLRKQSFPCPKCNELIPLPSKRHGCGWESEE